MSYAERSVRIPASVLSKMVKRPIPDSVSLALGGSANASFSTINGNCGLGSISGLYFYHKRPTICAEYVEKYGLGKLAKMNPWDNPQDVYMHDSFLYHEAMKPVHMELGDQFCALIVADATGGAIPRRSGYIISDNIARTIDPEPYETFKASYLAHYLIRKRIGIVYALPASINPVHQSERDTTIIQTWYWIPENAIKYHVRGYTKRINCLRLPTKAEFKQTWSKILKEAHIRRIGL